MKKDKRNSETSFTCSVKSQVMKLLTAFLLTMFMVSAVPAHARIGADMQISPTNTIVEDLSFDVSLEDQDRSRVQVLVVVTCVKPETVSSTNIHAYVELRDKDGFLGSIPITGKMEDNRTIISAVLDRRVIDQSEVVISTVRRIQGIDTSTGKPSGFVVLGRAYRIRLSEFRKQ